MKNSIFEPPYYTFFHLASYMQPIFKCSKSQDARKNSSRNWDYYGSKLPNLMLLLPEIIPSAFNYYINVTLSACCKDAHETRKCPLKNIMEEHKSLLIFQEMKLKPKTLRGISNVQWERAASGKKDKNIQPSWWNVNYLPFSVEAFNVRIQRVHQ